MASERALKRNGATPAASRLRVVARRVPAWLGSALCVAAIALIPAVKAGAGAMLAQEQPTANPPASQASPAEQTPSTDQTTDQKKQPNASAASGQAGQSSGQSNPSSGQPSGQSRQSSKSDQAKQSDIPDSDEDGSDDPYLRDDPNNPSPPAAKKTANARANAGDTGWDATLSTTDADTPSGSATVGADAAVPGAGAQPAAAGAVSNADSAAGEGAIPAAGDAAPAAVPAGPLTPEEARKWQVAHECADLLKMATDLKAAVDKTSKDELSVSVIRKAGEIEQYAHKVRNEPGLTAGKE
jgi:hypothetical protein